jgi:hypothetical protein
VGCASCSSRHEPVDAVRDDRRSPLEGCARDRDSHFTAGFREILDSASVTQVGPQPCCTVGVLAAERPTKLTRGSASVTKLRSTNELVCFLPDVDVREAGDHSVRFGDARRHVLWLRAEAATAAFPEIEKRSSIA